MSRCIFSRVAAAAVLLTSLSACGGAQMSPGAVYGVGAARTRSGSSGGALLYLAGYTQSTGSKTFMLTYPKGQLVGTIDTAASGLCTDANGNVYLLWRNAAIEYAHGGTTPLKTLRIPGAVMNDCSVDPSSGNLALTFSCPPCGQNVAIFPAGSGTSTRYSVPNALTCSYDDRGDLFTGGGRYSSISELPAGGGTFATITLNKTIESPGKIQWDGKYITLQDRQPPAAIYRIQISGSSGTIVGETKFRKYMNVDLNSWISVTHGSVLLPFSQHGNQANQLGFWKYPKGGHPTKVIKNFATGTHYIYAVATSDAPSKH